ncbi:hypothetical protein ACFOWE_11575 [Planomonospora corallina]|uniref:Uncharacterized protein n=1 Tax=Planomonospora corallina TaxID=1806052 RepID=A0ABV8I4W4_9ACTN
MSEDELAGVVAYALHRGLSRRPDIHAEVMDDLTPAERDEVARACDRHAERVRRITGTTGPKAPRPVGNHERDAGHHGHTHAGSARTGDDLLGRGPRGCGPEAPVRADRPVNGLRRLQRRRGRGGRIPYRPG